MSRDLGELLRETAAQPSRDLDTREVLTTARRQTFLARTGAGLGMVTVLAVVAVLVWPLVGLDGPDLPLEVTDQPPRSPLAEGDATQIQITGDPVLTASGSGWSVWVSPGPDGRWCVAAARAATEPRGRTGEPCWEISVPAGIEQDEVITVLGRASSNGDQLLVGSVDLAADEGVELTLADGSTVTATAATGGGVPFWVWFAPLDGAIPTSVEALSSTGSLGSVPVPELAPPDIVGSISEAELQDLQAVAEGRGISLDAAIVRHVWRDDFSFVVQEIQERFPESFAGAEIGGVDDVWVAFIGPAPDGALELIEDFDRRFERLGVAVDVRADGVVTDAQLAEAIERVHRSVFEAAGVADASTSHDRRTGGITTRVVLEGDAPATTIEDLQSVARESLVDVLGDELAASITVSVRRSYGPLGGSDDSD